MFNQLYFPPPTLVVQSQRHAHTDLLFTVGCFLHDSNHQHNIHAEEPFLYLLEITPSPSAPMDNAFLSVSCLPKCFFMQTNSPTCFHIPTFLNTKGNILYSPLCFFHLAMYLDIIPYQNTELHHSLLMTSQHPTGHTILQLLPYARWILSDVLVLHAKLQ